MKANKLSVVPSTAFGGSGGAAGSCLASRRSCASVKLPANSIISKTKCLKSIVLEQLTFNEELEEFIKSDELSKLYEIDSPYLSRTQIELLFDVYDGRKIQTSLLDEEETGACENEAFMQEAYGETEFKEHNYTNGVDNMKYLKAKPSIDNNNNNNNNTKALFSKSRKQAREAGSKGTWCRSLFDYHNNKITSCLSKSETNQEFSLSPSTTSNILNQSEQILTQSNEAIYNALLGAGFDTNDDNNINRDAADEDDEDELELKQEVVQMIGPLMSQLRRSSTLSDTTKMEQSFHSGLGQQQTILQEQLTTLQDSSGHISVCILDKRYRLLKNDAQNGRLWAHFENRLEDLCYRLRTISSSSSSSGYNYNHQQINNPFKRTNNRTIIYNRDFNNRIKRFNFYIEKKLRLQKNVEKAKLFNEKIRKEQLETFIDLSKNSLNHLIDAQLLLRNKLSSEQQTQSQQTTNLLGGPNQFQSNQQTIIKFNEYELLLKNNFNLLKIWQNLEETKHLACFVCEPIKANLADLFWFSRHEKTITLNKNDYSSSLLLPSSAIGVGLNDNLLLVSPLVSLDSIQVRIGLLQILEALHYLHAICKLIHRNLNPRNILIASNDNWKLSGLEFAIRFESATISESASIMANEGAGSLLRHSSGTTSQSALRRQRTLHQTKCEDIVRRPREDSRPQPDLNYMAPELYQNSKCSHKSDMFSYGLILAQTYDFRRHKPPINCKLSASGSKSALGKSLRSAGRAQQQQQQQQAATTSKKTCGIRKNSMGNMKNYEDEIRKLKERKRRKLSRMVPFEMRSILFEMLDCEPNLRPSANYALQLFRRPIELCKLNEDSLRHLRSSLSYLDTRCQLYSSGGLAATNHLQLAASNNNNATGGGSGGGQLGSATLTTTTTTINSGNISINNNNNNNNSSSMNCHQANPQTGSAFGAQNGALTSSSVQNQHQQQQQRQQQSRQAHKKRINYFRKVTLAPDRTPQRKQTRNLHLLNLLCRGVDSLATANTKNMEQLQLQQHQQATFPLVRAQFEQTFECLKRLYRRTERNNALECDTFNACPDSRSLMLTIALHRRLLDQLGAMRFELPPVTRLTVANCQSNRLAQNHRILAELEDRLQCLVSRQSMTKLVPLLTDPLLKLDEFLLVYELLEDLLAFVGQKCRQNFVQRGKQLLNELTPLTGCPSLSSSEEEEDNQSDSFIATTTVAPQVSVSSNCLSGSLATGPILTSSSFNNNFRKSSASNILRLENKTNIPMNSRFSTGNALAGPSSSTTTTSATPLGAGKQNQNKFNEYEEPLQRPQSSSPSNFISGRGTINNNSSYRQANLPISTKISITAPSPMGSMREVRGSADSHTISGALIYNNNSNRYNKHQEDDELIERTSELNLNSYGRGQQQFRKQQQQQQNRDETGADYYGSGSSLGGCAPSSRTRNGSADAINYNNNNNSDNNNNLNSSKQNEENGKSRSQLIDELLKTINDDSFNDIVDFNNKSQQQMSATQLANSNRPRSAIDGSQQQRFNTTTSSNNSNSSALNNQLNNQGRQGSSSTMNRPNSLALGNSSNNLTNQHQNRSAGTNQSTFDNVFRRMSTNIVQNFNKMSGLDQTPSSTYNNCTSNTTITINNDTTSSGALRREKSSNVCANSLYVDNQVPARRHSDNTINVPRIQVALSSPQASHGSRTNLNQRASVSATKLANKWKLTAKTNQRESSDKLSPNLSSALGYMRRHSSGNTTGSEKNESNTQQATNLLFSTSPFKTKSSSNLGIDFLLSNRSMKRRCSAASMLGHQTQRKAEDLIESGMKSVQNMFS